jgi:hypothetical protein
MTEPTPADFIAPDPDEPIPQPPAGGGATDKHLGGAPAELPEDVPAIEPDDDDTPDAA